MSPAGCPSSCLYGVLWLTETSQTHETTLGTHPDVSLAFLGSALFRSKVEPCKIEPSTFPPGVVYCWVVTVVKAPSFPGLLDAVKC